VRVARACFLPCDYNEVWSNFPSWFREGYNRSESAFVGHLKSLDDLFRKETVSEISIAKQLRSFLWTLLTPEKFFIADLCHDVLKF